MLLPLPALAPASCAPYDTLVACTKTSAVADLKAACRGLGLKAAGEEHTQSMSLHTRLMLVCIRYKT